MSDSPPEILLIIVPIFPLGKLVATPGALQSVLPNEIQKALNRHATGDWGELDDEDRKSNDRALLEGTRLLSAYKTQEEIRFWVITEWDRSVTTILLPQEY